MTLMDLRADLRQSQTLSPRLQQAVRLLQMSSLDFSAVVREALGQNPFLEAEEGHHGGSAGPGDSGNSGNSDDSGPSADGPGSALAQALANAPAGVFDGLELGALAGASVTRQDADLGSEGPRAADDFGGAQGAEAGLGALDGQPFDADAGDRELWGADAGTGPRRGEEGEFSALDLMAADVTLTAHLHSQLNVLRLQPRGRVLAATVVESLDDDGFLRTPVDDLIAVAALDPPATPAEMLIALRRVQSLDPAGVGACSVVECLQLQLPSVDCPKLRALAQVIVSHHIDALAARDTAALARALGEEPARILAACDRIRRLDPRPGWRYGGRPAAYVVPDVTVRKVRGQWTVQLNPAVVPRVRLNRVYEQLFLRHTGAQNKAMAEHLNEARWTVRTVEQRFLTILDVASAIVRRQQNFLEYGAMAMKPLGLKQIADELGIHESTVSRVTNNKYLATPVGVFELKHFFSRALTTASGGACSGIAIRGLLQDIIEAEPPHRPLSDAEITRQLAQQGLVVARRTVTKYRQMLKIEPVERRRRFAAAA